MAEISPRRGFDAYPMFFSLSSITTDEFLYLIASATSRFKTLPNLPFSREGAEEKCRINSPWALLFRLKAIGFRLKGLFFIKGFKNQSSPLKPSAISLLFSLQPIKE
jgi:hypothetical protein